MIIDLEKYSSQSEESILDSQARVGFEDNLSFLHFAAMLVPFLVRKWRYRSQYILSEEGRYSCNKQLQTILNYKYTTLGDYNSTHQLALQPELGR